MSEDMQQVTLAVGGCLALCVIVLFALCGTVVLVALILMGWKP